MDDFQSYLQFIREGNYVGGRGNTAGWGGLGYGGFQGAMAYQGVVAYFYDQLRPNTAVELNACIWNQVVADVIWRGPTKMEHYGQCREYPIRPGDTFTDNTPENGRCTDCRIIPVEQVKSAHYTACKKPWECAIPHPRKSNNARQVHRLSRLTNITTCGLLFRKWFHLRHDYEVLLQHVTHGQIVPSLSSSPHEGQQQSYEPQYFGGYCTGRGQYIPLTPPPEHFDPTTMYGM